MILGYKKVNLVTGIATGMLLAVTSISANAAPASTNANKVRPLFMYQNQQ